MEELALTADQISGVGIGTIAVVLVVALLIVLFVAKLVVRIVVAVAAIALAVVVWNQRGNVLDDVQDAAQRCEASFFGIHVEPTQPAARAACERISER